MDGTLLLLVGLQNFEELFVGVGVLGEALFDLVDVVDGVVEFDRGPLGFLDWCHGAGLAAVHAGAGRGGGCDAGSHGHGRLGPSVVRGDGTHGTWAGTVAGMLWAAWPHGLARSARVVGAGRAMVHGMAGWATHVRHGAGRAIVRVGRRMHVGWRLVGVARSRAVHHAHATGTSWTGGLSGRTRRRGAGAGSTHAVDGACDADAARSLCGCAGWGGDGDEVALAGVEAALDAVSGREEGVEALDEAWMPAKEGRDSFDDARGIYGLALELLRWKCR